MIGSRHCFEIFGSEKSAFTIHVSCSLLTNIRLAKLDGVKTGGPEVSARAECAVCRENAKSQKLTSNTGSIQSLKIQFHMILMLYCICCVYVKL